MNGQILAVRHQCEFFDSERPNERPSYKSANGHAFSGERPCDILTNGHAFLGERPGDKLANGHEM